MLQVREHRELVSLLTKFYAFVEHEYVGIALVYGTVRRMDVGITMNAVNALRYADVQCRLLG